MLLDTPAPGPLLRRFKGIEEPLHPGFLPGRGIFLDNPLSGGGIELFYHLFKGRFGHPGFFFLGQGDEFLYGGSDRTLYRFVAEPALLTLPMPLLSGRTFACQRKTS